MKLKRVKIYGFKTFADKTEVVLDGDVIAIVGPNGCGKSNIVDAILWGMGEINSRNLRAQTGQEVIFAGSPLRKPIGYAEVSLLFDNEDGALPVDSSEVCVARRLTRSGESEYSINRRPCRLRDVVDLLADSGLGRTGYSIVGQSEIDQALAASPEQRRTWLDEAAGVQRYRVRRTESLRRIASADEHLVRIRDIVAEIAAQREPLQEQALVARRYKTALNSLREIECGMLVLELAKAMGELRELDERVAGAVKLSQEEALRAQSLEVAAQRAQARIAELERDTEAKRSKLTEKQAQMERFRSAQQLAESRLEHLAELEQALGEQLGEVQAGVHQAQLDVERAESEETSEKVTLAGLRVELGGADEEAQSLASQLDALEKQLVQARQDADALRRQGLEAEHRQRRAHQVREEIAGIDAARPGLEQALREAQEAVHQGEDAVRLLEGKLKEVDQSIRALGTSDEQAATSQRKCLAELAALEGRRRGIEATIEAHEGLAQGTRAVLAAAEQGLLSGEYTPVGEAVEAKAEHALAVETALGAAVNDLIVPDEAHAKRAITLLKERRLGRATFQPITLMRAQHASPDLNDVLRSKGVVGLASDLVQCEPRMRPVLESLLGRVVVARSLDDALKLARTRGWSRIVTLDGEVVHASGAVAGGASSRQHSGIVQRKAEMGELEARIREAQRTVAELEGLAKVRTEQRTALASQMEQARKELEPSKLEWAEAQSWLLRLRHECQSAERSRDKLEQELLALSAPVPKLEASADPAELESRRDALLRQLASKSADAEQASQRLAEAEARLEQARRRRVEAHKRLDQARLAESARERRAEGLGPERERAVLQIAEAERSMAACQAEVAELLGALESLVARKTECDSEHRRLLEEAHSAHKSSMACSETAHQCELQRARADSKRAAAHQKLLEEYGVDTEEALERAPGVELPADAHTTVQSLRRELRAMGEVNLGAIEAYERLTERWEELTHQVDDIERGKAEIVSSVRELDRLTRERFSTTFCAVKESFGRMVVKLFGGGEGSLELTNPDDLLQTGVDVVVTVPGKKRQRLELLSGGERALCAVAFLFALLDVKPSPLVVLDEVDAPLDGRNVERFAELLREFTERTQFILVTHNPSTIASSDTWLGVTMQEPGVSTLVPVRIARELAVQEALVAGSPSLGRAFAGYELKG